MPPELIAALTTLGLAVVGALTAWVRVVQTRIESELQRNTRLTSRAVANTDAEIAKLRDRAQELAAMLHTYRDIVRYVNSLPEGRELLSRYQDRRRVVVHDDMLTDLERRLTQIERDTPPEGVHTP